MVLQAGAVFAGFTIERLVGVGSFGAVYLAWHQPSAQRVALKIVNDGIAADPQARMAFDRAAAFATGLRHPNIVAIQGYSSPGEPIPWLAMQLIEGGNASAIPAAAPDGLPVEQALRLIGDAAQALDYAHSQGVLHRDVKPSNLLIDRGGRALLTDFGIARSFDGTNAAVASTFAYTAPERFTNLPVDQRSDVYSLGCVLFELLTGRTPFPFADQAAVMAAQTTAPPPVLTETRRHLPRGLNDVIAIALAKNPDGRYRTCGDLVSAAYYAVAMVQQPVPPPAVPPGPFVMHPVSASDERGRTTRRRLLIAGGIAVPVIVAAATGVAILNPFAWASHSSQARTRADARDAALSGARRVAVDLTSVNPDDADGTIRTMESAATGQLLEQLTSATEGEKTVIVTSGTRITSLVLHAALASIDDAFEHATALVVLQQTRTPRNGTATIQQQNWQLGLTRTPGGWRADTVTAFGSATTQPAETAAADPPTGTGNTAFVDTAATNAIKTAGAQAITTIYQYNLADRDAYLAAVKAVTTDAAYRKMSTASSTAADAARQTHTAITAKVDPVGVAQLTGDQAELLCGMTASDTKDGVPATTSQGVFPVRMQHLGGRWLVSDIPGKV
ncbi:serine/threonine-protein kinase [Nocardia jiangxiensis]|uniref:non-specific serine/threonine protein kinase n=1 Tax=Nocardia jiangxiensis TaxID=282685 RepID=A0ABW6RSN6_9NOCA|nr:serine/threonine-protein kinase [Nocardia jiangxiensis]